MYSWSQYCLMHTDFQLCISLISTKWYHRVEKPVGSIFSLHQPQQNCWEYCKDTRSMKETLQKSFRFLRPFCFYCEILWNKVWYRLLADLFVCAKRRRGMRELPTFLHNFRKCLALLTYIFYAIYWFKIMYLLIKSGSICVHSIMMV